MLIVLPKMRLKISRFLFPVVGGLLFGYDIGVTSFATISIEYILLP